MKCTPVAQYSFMMDALICIRCGRVLLTMETLERTSRWYRPLD